MPSPTEVTVINQNLRRKYGDFHGMPKYRIVWSDHQTETRVGEVSVFYGSIFVRKEHGVHLVPKYQYIKERWILESYVQGVNAELIDSVSYEPIWTFQDAKGNYLEPIERAIDVIIHAIHNRNKMSPSDIEDAEELRMQKEYQFFRDYLANENPYIPTMLSNREAVIVPTKSFGEN